MQYVSLIPLVGIPEIDDLSVPDFVVGLEVGSRTLANVEGGVKKDDMPLNERETTKSLMLFPWMAVCAPSTGRWGVPFSLK